MTDSDEDFGVTTEEQANEAQGTLNRYANERDAIIKFAEKILDNVLLPKDRTSCLAQLQEALEEAYYTLEKDLHEQVREFESRDNALHKKLERMGL